MTSHEFEFLWRTSYPRTSPLPHLFRQDYSANCFRIKSLPNSKTFPGNNKELKILLERQNQIITDILGNKSPVFGITGEYNFGEEITEPEFLTYNVFKPFEFIPLRPIDLFEISRSDFKPNSIYTPYLTEFVWEQSKYNDLLKAMAYDEIRMFFMSPEKKCLVAPHDGGIDFVVMNDQIKNYYMSKYSEWLAKPSRYMI
jgi:hypothetical protein